MREIQINLEDLIGNAMIEVYKKDKRRVLDIKDIVNYHKLVTFGLNNLGLNPVFFGDDDELYQSASKYFCSQNGYNFIILPWISIEKLKKHYQKNIHLEVYKCFCNAFITDNLLNRTEEELKRFNEINEEVIDTYKNILRENNNLEIKKEKKQKKLQKIKNIWNKRHDK